MGLLPNTQNRGLRMRRECRERFPPPPRFSDPDMHHGTCVTHVPWCMPGSLTSGFLWKQWRGKRSRHSRRMRNPRFCIFGKRPIGLIWCNPMREDSVGCIPVQSLREWTEQYLPSCRIHVHESNSVFVMVWVFMRCFGARGFVNLEYTIIY